MKRFTTYDNVSAIVVGASMGIGRAISRELVMRGASVGIVARGDAALSACGAELSGLRKGSAQKIVARRLDVTSSDATHETIRDLVGELGGLDLVFICSGQCRPEAFENISPEALRKALDANLLGAWNVSQAVLPYLSSGGAIVPTASVAGYIGLFGYTAYSASKFAVIGFAESLRSELAPRNVRVSVLCPPDTDTPGLALERNQRPPETQAICGNAGLLSAEFVASYTLDRLRGDDFIIIPGWSARFTWWVKRLLPNIVYEQIDAAVRRTQRVEHVAIGDQPR